MRLRARHLQEHRLFECYVAERQGESVDPRVAEHLADCETCAGRYVDLTGAMEGLRLDAVAESDAAFTPDHLRAQQQQIARRIEHIGRAARVITFPKSSGADRMIRAPYIAAHHHPRWVAAAVAAGVFVGVALGASFEWERVRQTPASALLAVAGNSVNVAAHVTPALPDNSVATMPFDIAAADAFLSELEVALDRPRTRALQPFDDITPHVREIRAIR